MRPNRLVLSRCSYVCYVKFRKVRIESEMCSRVGLRGQARDGDCMISKCRPSTLSLPQVVWAKVLVAGVEVGYDTK